MQLRVAGSCVDNELINVAVVYSSSHLNTRAANLQNCAMESKSESWAEESMVRATKEEPSCSTSDLDFVAWEVVVEYREV